jgi:photosynthetic reaction center cytochrome c subunit
MEFITASLGVGCDHCHVQGSFDKDDKKPKQTARMMMKMMFAIDKDNFESKREVTCYSCHRGAPRPLSIPLVAGENPPEMPHREMSEGKGAAKPAEPSLPSGDELLNKYIQALGGEAALAKVSTRVEKGKVTLFGGRQFDTATYQKVPDQRTTVVQLPNGESVTSYDGHEGWLTVPGRAQFQMGTADMDASQLGEAVAFPARNKNIFGTLKTEKTEKIGEQNSYLVVGTRNDQPPVRLYFDQQSGLLLRMVQYAESPLGRFPTQIDFGDYREVDGVKVPFRLTASRPAGQTVTQMEQVQQNLPIDAARFAKPAAPAEGAPH